MERIFNNVKITSSFEIPETRENLVSGETIGQHFGKIAKVIDDLENGEFNCNLTIDDTLSDTSENPVQNKVINAALNEKASKDTMTGATSSADGTSGLVPAPASGDEDKFLRGNGTWAIPEKLDSSSYTTVTIDTSDWTANPDGGYMFTYTLPITMPYDNFNFDVVLSADQSAAKLQIEAWSCVIADGNITQTTSNSSTTAFTFYAFTTQPSVALTVGIQGVS